VATDFYDLVRNLKTENKAFAVATVIAVKGSASARPGSKAIISADGKNIFGWVGGGCAESFVCKNALECMESGDTKIIEADLDHEIFGLGMPCGGIMTVYIEPQLPREKILIVESPELEMRVTHLASSMGIDSLWQQGPVVLKGSDLERGLYALASAIAKSRQISFTSLKEARQVFPQGDGDQKITNEISELLIVGTSRITEEMAKFGTMLKWKTRVYGWNLDPKNYPAGVTLEESTAGFDNFSVREGSAVLVASHHKGDHDFIRQSTLSGAAWVGLIASTKRSGIILKYLSEMDLPQQQIARVFAPAGLEMNCKNPTEIALSCVAQIIELKA
jgi:xanthine/CO dehydrogenase XdhC/CoxF family maturation factor